TRASGAAFRPALDETGAGRRRWRWAAPLSGHTSASATHRTHAPAISFFLSNKRSAPRKLFKPESNGQVSLAGREININQATADKEAGRRGRDLCVAAYERNQVSLRRKAARVACRRRTSSSEAFVRPAHVRASHPRLFGNWWTRS